MNKNVYFIFIAASFALLVSAPGRLAYGLVLIVELDLIVLGTSVFCSFIKQLDLPNLYDTVTLAFLVFLTILYKEILILFSPVIALNLGIVLYIPSISVFLLGNVFAERVLPPAKLFSQCLMFSAFAFLFFLLRDILGYGTLTLPKHNGIAEFFLFDSCSTSFLAFFASIPGALLLTVFCMIALLATQYKMNIIEKAEAEYGSD